ncbi:zinc metalloproteinase-disintegrin-like crotastatin [Anguilla anguilla]|uniref:zinc metalloproteinase-disintegrin-like crotastatin n=1 Tax=Anguilla anguilla TaxID=7936 RepID=UPI0015A8494C|nr:zinc metalloproteinase-disintegrin-like crotastatin [Anguilla anguilla]
MDGRSLSLVLLALSSPHLLAGLHPADDGRDYQVVRPIKLHALHRRDTQSPWPDEVTYAMTVSGRDVVMRLERNLGLLSRRYTETHYTTNGTRVTSARPDLDLCYYDGRILNDSESVVSISTCNGLRGYLRTASQQYLIEPLSGNDTGDHSLQTYQNPESTCGVTNSSWDAAYPTATPRGRSRASADSLLKQKKYVELYLVVDNREYQKLRRDFAAVRKRAFQMVNFVNAVYQPLNTSVVLVGLEVWTDRDWIEVVASPGQTLGRFTAWRNEVLLGTGPHDSAMLITGIDLEGSIVGIANVEQMCTISSTGVVQDHKPQAIAVAATLAHELGHNLGMRHDSRGCSCGARVPCIMSAVLGQQVPRLFSNCSAQGYEAFVLSRVPPCLFDKPDIVLASDSLCGNGVVERGEECDCGIEKECPCCDASTCTLTEGSECATGECCKNCRFASPLTECRSRRDECDLAEFCTGRSAQCPQDVFSQNGIPCKGRQGYCRDGRCPLLADQCVKTWGDTARVGRYFCYEQNIQGTYYGFCNRTGREEYVPCKEKDVMCGKLFCTGGSREPSSGQAAEFSDCRATFNRDQSEDQGLVETGTRCGDGLVCMDSQCVGLEMAYGPSNCSAKCKGHAVCNHRSECQCQPGWLPPDCESSGDSDQAVSSGTIIAIATATGTTLVLLLALAGMAVHLKRRQKLGGSPRPPPPEKDLGLNNPAFPVDIYSVYQNPSLKNMAYPNYPQLSPGRKAYTLR